MGTKRNDDSEPITNLFGPGVNFTPEQTRALVRLALELDPDLAEHLPSLEDWVRRGSGAAEADSVEEE